MESNRSSLRTTAERFSADRMGRDFLYFPPILSLLEEGPRGSLCAERRASRCGNHLPEGCPSKPRRYSHLRSALRTPSSALSSRLERQPPRRSAHPDRHKSRWPCIARKEHLPLLQRSWPLPHRYSSLGRA